MTCIYLYITIIYAKDVCLLERNPFVSKKKLVHVTQCDAVRQ